MPGAATALAICSALASVASTLRKWRARPMAAWPLPVAQSHTRSRPGALSANSRKSSSGYVGLERAYPADFSEKWSRNVELMRLLPVRSDARLDHQRDVALGHAGHE